MNVDRLHSIAKAVSAEIQGIDLAGKMAALQSALTNQANSPQEPSYQQTVATSRQALVDVLAIAPSDSYTPTWRQAMEELGFDNLLGAELLGRIDEIFNRNQITTSVARDEITQLTTDLQELVNALQSMLESFAYFKISTEDLEPGEAEVGVLIPRPAVKEELPELGEEFQELQKILSPFLELAEGSRPPLKVRTISSSDYTVYVAMAPGAALSLATALDRILDVYKKILDIRASHQQLADQGVPPEVLAPLKDHANKRMADETERLASEMVDASAAVADSGRANELKIEVRLSLNALANRIDHGYNLDVRAQPEPEPEPSDEETESAAEGWANREALRRINNLAPNLAFVNRTGKPILSLPEGETIHEEPDGPEKPPAPE